MSEKEFFIEITCDNEVTKEEWEV